MCHWTLIHIVELDPIILKVVEYLKFCHQLHNWLNSKH